MTSTPQLKIFVGYRLTPEVRVALTPLVNSDKLGILSHISTEGKEYLGFYLDAPSPTLDDVKEAQEKINTLLLSELPELPLSSHTFVVFPQAFLI